MDRVLDRDLQYLRTPLIALVVVMALVSSTVALAAEGDPAASEPVAAEATTGVADPAQPPPATGEEVPATGDPAQPPPATGEEVPATGDPGGASLAAAEPTAQSTPAIDPPVEPPLAPDGFAEPVIAGLADPDVGALNFPVAPAADVSPPVAALSPEEVAPEPSKRAATPPAARPVSQAPAEPSMPAGSGAGTEPVFAVPPEPDQVAGPSAPLLMPDVAPDPEPIVALAPEETAPKPFGSPTPVRPVVVVDPPTVIEPEPALIEPAPVTTAEPEVVTLGAPVATTEDSPTEDPIFFPTSLPERGDAEPPPVALEIPFDTSGVPPPASSGASATSSSSSGVASGVGPAALAALVVLIALGAAATVRFTTQTWRSSYLLSLPERPG